MYSFVCLFPKKIGKLSQRICFINMYFNTPRIGKGGVPRPVLLQTRLDRATPVNACAADCVSRQAILKPVPACRYRQSNIKWYGVSGCACRCEHRCKELEPSPQTRPYRPWQAQSRAFQHTDSRWIERATTGHRRPYRMRRFPWPVVLAWHDLACEKAGRGTLP